MNEAEEKDPTASILKNMHPTNVNDSATNSASKSVYKSSKYATFKLARNADLLLKKIRQSWQHC